MMMPTTQFMATVKNEETKDSKYGVMVVTALYELEINFCTVSVISFTLKPAKSLPKILDENSPEFIKSLTQAEASLI